MRTTLKTSIGIVIVAALAVLAPPAVQAAPPQAAGGDFVVEALIPTSVEPRGNVTLIELTATFRLDGTFDGAFVADFSIIHLGPIDQPARQIFIAEGTFTGEVDGSAGSFDFVFVGEIDAQGNAEGDLIVGRGTDDLANLSGRIALAGIAGVAGIYEGSIHFAP